MTPTCQHATSRRCWSAISMQRGMHSGSPAVASSPATAWTPPSKASAASCRELPANKGWTKRRVEHSARHQHARREAISMQSGRPSACKARGHPSQGRPISMQLTNLARVERRIERALRVKQRDQIRDANGARRSSRDCVLRHLMEDAIKGHQLQSGNGARRSSRGCVLRHLMRAAIKGSSNLFTPQTCRAVSPSL
jgi:hypothetical protein